MLGSIELRVNQPGVSMHLLFGAISAEECEDTQSFDFIPAVVTIRYDSDKMDIGCSWH